MIATTSTQAERYLAGVRTHLADLPEAEREDLLEDLEDHLAEVAAETDEPLEQRLGPPERYAAELRASAGLGDPGRHVRRWSLADNVRTNLRPLQRDPRVAAVVGFLPELRPGWWVVRGYALVLAWAVSRSEYGRAMLPLPGLFGSRLIGLIVAAAAIVGSVWLGKRSSRAARLAAIALNVLTVIALLTISSAVHSASMQSFYVNTGMASETVYDETPAQLEGSTLFTEDGHAVLNIYPYDAHGQPLSDVRLYDERGKPLDLLVPYDRRGRSVITSYPLDTEGRPVTNAFPQHHAVQRNTSAPPQPASGLDARPDVDIPALQAAPTPRPSAPPAAKQDDQARTEQRRRADGRESGELQRDAKD